MEFWEEHTGYKRLKLTGNDSQSLFEVTSEGITKKNSVFKQK